VKIGNLVKPGCGVVMPALLNTTSKLSEAVDDLRKCRLHLIRIADVGSHKRRARTLAFD